MERETPQYGTIERTTVIDDNGSTRSIEKNYFKGKVQPPERLKYRIRHRVTTQEEADAISRPFLTEAANDESKHDVSVEYERSPLAKQHGYFYVVLCYTKLVYNNTVV